MKKRWLLLATLALLLAACGSAGDKPNEPQQTAQSEQQTDREEMTMRMKIAETAVSVEWEANEAVEALQALCAEGPLEIRMSMYGGFEQVGAIGTDLPRNDRQTTTQAGDIVLYAGDQIVVFYGTNSWAYTRLGRITDQSAEDLARLLGNGDVVLTIE